MDNDAHLILLDTVNNLEGMVVLSGYNTDMYNDILTGWQKQEKQSSAAGRKGSVKRLECLWLSPNVLTESKAA